MTLAFHNLFFGVSIILLLAAIVALMFMLALDYAHDRERAQRHKLKGQVDAYEHLLRHHGIEIPEEDT